MKVKFSFFTGVVALLVMSCLHLIVNGYEFAMGDQDIQIPMIKKILNPNLFSKDVLFNSIDGYVSYYPLLMAKIIGIVGSIKTVFFSIYFISILFTYFSIYKIAEVLYNNSVAIICIAFFLFHNSVLGGSEILFSRLYPAQMATPFVLFSIYLFLKEKYMLSFALLGLFFNIHVLLAAYVVFFQGMYLIYKYFKRNCSLRVLVSCAMTFIAFAIPSTVKILSNLKPVENVQASLELFRIQGAHHSFPSSWSPLNLVAYGVFIAIGFYCYKQAISENKKLKVIFVSGISILFLCIVGTIFTEVLPSITIVKAQLFRSTSYFTIFILILIAGFVASSWSKSLLQNIVLFIIAVIFIAPMSSITPFIALVLIVTFEILNKYYRSTKEQVIVEFFKRYFKFLLALLLILSVIVLILKFDSLLVKVELLWSYRLRIGLFLLSLSLLGVYFLIKNSKFLQWYNMINLLLIVGLFVPSIFSMYHSLSRYDADWIEIQQWSKDNTRKDALFLTPPEKSGFRVFSERSVVVERRDGTQQYFDDKFGIGWLKRVNEVDIYGVEFNELEYSDILALHKKYQFNYLLVSSNNTLNFKTLFSNNKYKLYFIN